MNKLPRLTGWALAMSLAVGVLLLPEARAGSASGTLSVRVVVLPSCSTAGNCAPSAPDSGMTSPPPGPETGTGNAPLRIIEERNGPNRYRTIVY